MNEYDDPGPATDDAADTRPDLPPAARRALAEAAARRKAETTEDAAVREVGGRGGLDPARFGDWEINGRAIDF